jgi:hypothetical protein
MGPLAGAFPQPGGAGRWFEELAGAQVTMTCPNGHRFSARTESLLRFEWAPSRAAIGQPRITAFVA